MKPYEQTITTDARVTISRPQGFSEDQIHIQIVDRASRLTIATVKIDPADLTLALTGLSERPATAVVNTSGMIGKKKIVEDRVVKLPDEIGYNRREAEKYIEENYQEEGYILDSYLGSQSSLAAKNGVYYARYSVVRYE